MSDRGEGLVEGVLPGYSESVIVGGYQTGVEVLTGLEDCPIEELTEQELAKLKAGEMKGRGIGISGRKEVEDGE